MLPSNTLNKPIPNLIAPKVRERDGEVYTNSRDVAEYFGKAHSNLLKAIDELALDGSEWGTVNFNLTPYVHPQNGRTYRYYDMIKDGFTELVMGFTGKEAKRFKRAYIQRFNDMEQEIRDRPAHALPQTFEDALSLAADQSEQIAQLEHQVEVVYRCSRQAIVISHINCYLALIGKSFTYA